MLQQAIQLHRQGRLSEAANLYKAILHDHPENVDALHLLGIIAQKLGQSREAVTLIQSAIGIDDGVAEFHANLGSVYKESGQLRESANCYRRAMELQPDNHSTHSCYLYLQQFLPEVGPTELFRLHAEWNDRHAASSIPPHHANVVDPSRRLRLGFVSPSFGMHPGGYLTVPCLEHLDRNEFEIYCYSDRLKEDQITQRIRHTSECWHSCREKSDDELFELVTRDQIDILFAMAAHIDNSRLLLFSQKPAPVQVSWTGYVGTTGLKAIDYRLADRIHVQDGDEQDYIETVLRLPDDYICYSPPEEIPAVSPPPCERNGYITFGSFNQIGKINSQVVDLWSSLLRNVANSRLMLKAMDLDDEQTCIRIRDQFSGNGIDSTRLIFSGRSPHYDFLESYNQVDISLDPFPFSSGITAIESLLMGVPIVTLPGTTFASRHCASHLLNCGLEHWVTRDQDDFLLVTQRIATDRSKLAELRATLRHQLLASPVCDGPRFARNFGQACRVMWERWCYQR